ncbi:MAG: MMPL family transporter, partial [Planctomycetaceae bacterium]|nr:MMPL family transporter [Planctomycetaceae bacterium]
MERFFAIRDSWRNGISLWIVALAVFSLPVLGVWLKDLRLENDVTTWLPADDPDSVVLEWFDSEFESEDRLLVSWDTSSIHDPRVQMFVDQLRVSGSLPATLSDTTTPHQAVALMENNKIDPETAVRRLTGILIGNGFLKVQLSEPARLFQKEAQDRVRQTAEEFLGEEVSVVAAVEYREPMLPPEEQDGETEEDEEVAVVNIVIPEHDFQLRWSGMSATSERALELIKKLNGLEGDSGPIVESAFFAPGAPVAVSIAVTEYGEEAHRQTMNDLRTAAQAIGVSEEEFRIGGTTVARDQLSVAGNEAVWNQAYPIWNFFKRSPILLSGIVGIVTSFVMLRSPMLAIKVLLAAGYACLVVLALIPATGKPLNIVLIVLPNLLLVLTMSGAIHVANYWKHAVAEGNPRPVATAIRLAWQPCVLASVTTAIGMASLITAVLNPVQEFGIYSSIGCIISLLVILFLFPSLLTFRKNLSGRAFESTELDQKRWESVAGFLVRHRLLVNFGCLILFVFSVYGLRWFQTETRVIRYFLPHTRIVQDYNFLEESLAGIVSIETIVHFDEQAQDEMSIVERMEFVRHLEAKIAEHPWISGTMSLADFRPVSTPPAEDAGTFTKVRYRKSLVRMQQEIFERPQDNVTQFAK